KISIFLIRLLSDLLLLNVTFLIAAVLSQSWNTLIDRYYMFFLLVGLNILWILLSNTSGFYSDFHSRNFPFQFVNILKETAAQVITSILFIFLVKEDLFTRNFIILYTILLIFFISLRTIVFRKVLKSLRRKGKNIRNLLIIGTGEVAYNFKSMINSNPDFGYHFTGFVTETEIDDSANDVVGKTDELEKLISELSVDEVVIAVKDKSDVFLDEIITICNRKAVRTHIIPDYFKFISNRFQVTMFGDFPIITVRKEPLEEVHWRFFKRMFDIIFSLLVIIFIFSWLYPIIFILTKIFSPGPVFFIQERVGIKNEKFNCYKFRTMIVSAKNSASNFQPVVENDPRVTKIGGILRKSNLDEFPQFINVLKGDMSVVGPRPHAVFYDERYGKIVDAIRIRHLVKPGITGWAQVRGLRGDVPDEEENIRRTKKRIEYDVWYIENWSLTLDVQIILITIWQMLKGKTKGV
ncbi:MAG: undecaprenyl-phosphate glucose phosphotransferase, partial [Bacteroidetes bacterium]|nr:undecaprenyl-phosphate glucose phosphotransferase [Bacteroidota bacterium]